MKVVTTNCKWNTKLIDETLNEGLPNTLKEFAKEYGHRFRSRNGNGAKYAVVYLAGDVKALEYIGEDCCSDIWFDDKAVARLAIELYRNDLIRYFKHKKHPKYNRGDKFYINHAEPTIDGKYIINVNGNYEIERIDDISFNTTVYYMRRLNGTDKVLVREDILDNSRRIGMECD